MRRNDIKKLCSDCVEHGYRSICVPPAFVEVAKVYGVSITTVAGYPFGYDNLASKLACLDTDADEYDVTMNVSYFRSGLYLTALLELTRFVAATTKPVNVDIQSELLLPGTLSFACSVARDSGARRVIISSNGDRVKLSLHDERIEIVGVPHTLT